VPYAFAHKHSLYLGYLAVSYAAQYQQPLGTLLNDKYAKSLPFLFDRDHSVDAIAAALPAYPRELFRPEVLTEIKAGKPNWFTSGPAQRGLPLGTQGPAQALLRRQGHRRFTAGFKTVPGRLGSARRQFHADVARALRPFQHSLARGAACKAVVRRAQQTLVS